MTHSRPILKDELAQDLCVADLMCNEELSNLDSRKKFHFKMMEEEKNARQN